MLGNYVLRLILTNPNPFWKTSFFFFGGGGGDSGGGVWSRVGVTSSISHIFFSHMTKLFSFKKLKNR